MQNTAYLFGTTTCSEPRSNTGGLYAAILAL